MGDQQGGSRGRISAALSVTAAAHCAALIRPPAPVTDLKIIEITNVDFSLRQFLLPLMRGIRARGHEVIGVCAEGPTAGQRARGGISRDRRAVPARG